MESFINCKPDNLNGFTLIIPSNSVGNVGQLTIDLLITSYNFEKLGIIWDSSIMPIVGSDPFVFDSQLLCTACELFVNYDLKVALIQLRSSLEYKLALQFFEKIKLLVKNFKFKEVLVLTTSYEYEMHHINQAKFRYISNVSAHSHILETNENILELDIPSVGNYKVLGGGFAINLYEHLNPEINCTVLIKFCSEGDNRFDAIKFLRILSSFIPLLQNSSDLKFPCSWNFVYGNPPPIGIY